uniref:Ig-like domain-containing protein n=1 Tax=Pygocentrus nattereri TaxID=42514 RepID=A0A3B4CPJ8_PYGNA
MCKMCDFFFTESCVSQSIGPLDNKVLIHAREDETVTLSCKYEYSTTPNSLQWYRQYTGSRPEYLLLKYPGSADVTRADPTFLRLDATDNNNKWNLSISSAAVSDSALYYCAMQPTQHCTKTDYVMR